MESDKKMILSLFPCDSDIFRFLSKAIWHSKNKKQVLISLFSKVALLASYGPQA